MKHHKLQYYLIDFLVGTILIWIPIFLKVKLEYNSIEIGILLTISGITGIIFTFILANIAQKILDQRKIFRYGIFTCIIPIFLIMLSDNFYMIMIILILINIMRYILYIITDDITINYVNQNKDIEFGKIRSYGSLGWGSNFLINYILFTINPYLIFITIFIVSLGLFYNSFKLPISNEEKKHFKIKDGLKLLKYKNYVLFCFIIALMWSIINNATTMIEYSVIDLNGSLAIFVILSVLGTVFDMIFMNLLSSKILKKLNGRKYFLLFIALFLIKFSLLSLFLSPQIIYFTLLIDPIFFALMIPFLSVFIKNEINVNLSVIALMSATLLNAFMQAIFAYVYGFVYEVAGAKMVFKIMLVMILIIIVLITKVNFQKIDYSLKQEGNEN